jgi:transposase
LIEKCASWLYPFNMARKAQPIKLFDDEHRSLKTLLRRGSTPARTQTRARVLDLLHRGQHPDAIAETLQVTTATVYNLKRRYLTDGLAAALHDKPRSGRPVEIDGRQRAKITALACSEAPSGHARWSLRLLADKAVELGLVENISHSAVKEILKKTNSSRT